MKRVRAICIVLVTLCITAAAAQGDLAAARAESNLEKRADKALDNAIDVARSLGKTYLADGMAKTQLLLAEIRESVELAYNSLKESGRNPRKRPKYFKRAELKTRELLKRLGGFSDRMAFDDRAKVEPLRAYVRKVHDEILEGVLGTEVWQAKP